MKLLNHLQMPVLWFILLQHHNNLHLNCWICPMILVLRFVWYVCSFKSTWIFFWKKRNEKKSSCSALLRSLCTFRYFVLVFLRNKVRTNQKIQGNYLLLNWKAHTQIQARLKGKNVTRKSHFGQSCTKPFNCNLHLYPDSWYSCKFQCGKYFYWILVFASQTCVNCTCKNYKFNFYIKLTPGYGRHNIFGGAT